MAKYSTRSAAKKLGIDYSTLSKYITTGKVTVPETINTGDRVVHAWSDEDIERVRQLLPRIANGRKTRYKKQQSAGVKPKKKQPKKK